MESKHLVTGNLKSNGLRGRRTASIQVNVQPEAHFTRVWAASDSAVSFTFRLLVLPVRLLALSLLWATSTPERLAAATTVVGILSVLSIV
jgi:hypothetical protein